MTTSTDPTIVTIPDADDRHFLNIALTNGRKRMDSIPRRHRDAVVDVDGIADWVRTLIDIAVQDMTGPGRAMVQRGPSLVVTGPTGTGKTRAVYGAMRALSVSGAACGWRVTTAADMYAHLRPRHGIDAEEEFERYATSPVLALDELDAAKRSDWLDEVNYRLVNYRYEHELPTLFVTNLAPAKLSDAVDDRVVSRIVEMSKVVRVKGVDRRYPA